MIAKGPIALALIAVTLAGAAGAYADGGKSEALAAVRAYNEAVILAYRTSDPTPVKQLVGDKELRKLTALIDLKAASSLVLESTLEKLDVTAVERPTAGVMTVRTAEQWRYFDRPLKPGIAPGQEFVTRMTLEYSFAAVDGGWKMDHARTLTHEYVQPAGSDRNQSNHDNAPDRKQAP